MPPGEKALPHVSEVYVDRIALQHASFHVNVGDGDGANVGIVGAGVGSAVVGENVGEAVILVGDRVGCVGDGVGDGVGSWVGSTVGSVVGSVVGSGVVLELVVVVVVVFGSLHGGYGVGCGGRGCGGRGWCPWGGISHSGGSDHALHDVNNIMYTNVNK